ncbi:MAG: SDR family oxidoreductase [Candidatus Omnitrophota bacterium]
MSKTTVIVTGGSRGLGLELVRVLLREGYQVATCSRTLSPELQALRARHSGLLWQKVDVSDEKQVRVLYARVKARFKNIDVLINNAAIPGPLGFFKDVALKDWEQALRVNLLGAVYHTHAALPLMGKKPGGLILNVSAPVAGDLVGCSAYAVAKTALNYFSDILAAELKKSPIEVRTVFPGTMDTGFVKAALRGAGKKIPFSVELARQKRLGALPGAEAAAEKIVRMIVEWSARHGRK